jgi:hypothetical protein
MLKYIDSLCEEILSSESPRRENAVRDAEIHRLADASYKAPLNLGPTIIEASPSGHRLRYQDIARSKGVTEDVVRQVRSRKR